MYKKSIKMKSNKHFNSKKEIKYKKIKGKHWHLKTLLNKSEK